MGWTTPRDWTDGEVVDEDMMDTHVKNNLRYLKGLDGVPTIESGLTIDNTDGDERLLLPLLSTAECSTVLNAEGEVAFDEQTHRVKIYDNDGVESLVSTADVDDTAGGTDAATTTPISSNVHYDHCQAADPHAGYVLESLADAAGDTFYATDDNTWGKLTKGTATQFYRMNSGATAPEWTTGGVLTIGETGVFAGNPPDAYTDLDLSAVVGAQAVLVMLRFRDDTGNGNYSVRRNGDAQDYEGGDGANCGSTGNTGLSCCLITPTDSSGVVEWEATDALGDTTVDVIAWITL